MIYHQMVIPILCVYMLVGTCAAVLLVSYRARHLPWFELEVQVEKVN